MGSNPRSPSRADLPRPYPWPGPGPKTQPVVVAGSRSLFDPQRLVELLAMPAGAEPAAMLCIGPVPDLGPA